MLIGRLNLTAADGRPVPSSARERPVFGGPNVPHCTTGLADRLVPRSITVARRPGGAYGLPRRFPAYPSNLHREADCPVGVSLLGSARAGAGVSFPRSCWGSLQRSSRFLTCSHEIPPARGNDQVSRKGIFRTHCTRR